MNTSRTCSLCGGNDHNSSTCAEVNGGDTGNGIMLFGVRLREGSGSFRKSVSMNNLSQLYEEEQQQPQDSSNVDAGYASDDVVHPSGRCRERKRGIPWTEEEHRLFLLGLQKVGKGDWRGISRNFVKTRTPTQVASHAQKYFLRRNNMGRRRRRSSLFDITTDAFTKSSMEEDHPNIPHEAIRPPPLPPPQPQPDNRPVKFPVKMNPAILAPPPSGESTTVKCTLTLRGPNYPAKINTSDIIRPIPMFPLPPYSKLAHLNIKETTPEEDPLPLTLKLSSAPHSDEKSPSGTFQAMSGGGDSVDIVSVA